MGLAHLSPVAEALAKRIETDRAEWERLAATRRTVEAWMANIHAPDVRRAGPEPVAAVATVAVGGAR